ncbi:MAG TPA: glycosyltransferase family 4 protein [Candidatus Deferrimicrobiaceae bacterium]|nr:glycosyltransferase family 4 protein [Candidatus Deferrimicrobiaceae bacterium]
MLTVAYLANLFPASVEPYVSEEIQELQRRGVKVIPGSVRRPDKAQGSSSNGVLGSPILCLQPVRMPTLLRSFFFTATHWQQVSILLVRILFLGKESPSLRLRALLHTWLGAYYAVSLQKREVDHIHVHHGYFGSWIAMVAARLLGISFSLTLHGSDLLLHGAYLDTKLKYCRSCLTISDYNRRYIFDHFPAIDPKKVIVSRLGVDTLPAIELSQRIAPRPQNSLRLLAVGRLHAVKGHAFLLHACARLRDSGLDFKCAIAGEGPERQRLELLIRSYRLQGHVTLLGHVAREEMEALYRDAEVVVLTSLSEGIPLVLMEAMVRGRIVLAPAITGIPELVIPGKTGFLYKPGDLEDFLRRILFLRALMPFEHQPSGAPLYWISHAARVHVLHNFNRQKNLTRFADAFLRSIQPPRSSPHADPLLQ